MKFISVAWTLLRHVSCPHAYLWSVLKTILLSEKGQHVRVAKRCNFNNAAGTPLKLRLHRDAKFWSTICKSFKPIKEVRRSVYISCHTLYFIHRFIHRQNRASAGHPCSAVHLLKRWRFSISNSPIPVRRLLTQRLVLYLLGWSPQDARFWICVSLSFASSSCICIQFSISYFLLISINTREK